MKAFESVEATFLVYVAVFIGVLLAFEGLRQLLSIGENANETRNRRMRMIKEGTSTEDVLNLLSLPAARSKGNGSVLVSLRRLLGQAGLSVNPFLFVLFIAILGGLIFVFAAPAIGSVPAAFGAPVLAFGVPLLLVNAVRSSRRAKLTAQLPDALDLMARGLKVGHPLSVTVERVASEMPDPIGSEFGIIQDQVQYGDDIVTAFRDFADRADFDDARYLAVSVGIQHGTGGSLSRVLQVLGKVIRDRAIMRKKIKAISSEGRLSALILTFLPGAIFLSIHMTTPSFYGDVSNDPIFVPVMVTIVMLIVLQGVILNRLASFKI